MATSTFRAHLGMEVNGYKVEPGADLSGANLRDVDLRYANLRNANLTEAELAGADLTGADLMIGSLKWKPHSASAVSHNVTAKNYLRPYQTNCAQRDSRYLCKFS